MKKLKLNLDDLKVESFQVTPEDEAAGEGTVEGYCYDCETFFGPSCRVCPTDVCTNNTLCGQNTCAATCPNTCPNTCANTCPNTCAHTCAGNTCVGPTCFDTCGRTCFYTCPPCIPFP